MKKLKKIYVEITSVCNLRCSFCAPTVRPAHFMSEADFVCILNKIEGKSDVLYLHVMGEPLLHPLFCRFVSMADARGFKVFVTTNGTLLAEREAELLECSALSRFNISLQSLEQFDCAVRLEKLHTLLTSAENLVRSNPKLLINLRLWTSDQVLFTLQLCEALEKRYSLESGSVMRRMEESSGIFLAPGIAVHRAETFDWPEIGGSVSADGGARAGCTGFCMALRDQAAVLCDGTVVPCCLDRNGVMALGNILSAPSWDDIMMSQRARALYNGFSHRKVIEPLCMSCTYRTRFNR